METYSHYAPVFTVKGIEFREVKLPIQEKIPFDRGISKEYAKEKSDNIFGMSSIQDRIVDGIRTISSGFFTSEAILSIEFHDGSSVTFKPVNCPYIDTDIYFENINIRYRPKTQAGFPEGYPKEFDDFAMKGLQNNDYLKGVNITSFDLYTKGEFSDERSAIKGDIYMIKVKGLMDFAEKDEFVYGHKEKLEINLYPDVLHKLVEVGPGVSDKDFRLKLEK